MQWCILLTRFRLIHDKNEGYLPAPGFGEALSVVSHHHRELCITDTMGALRRSNLFHLKVGSGEGRQVAWPVLVHIHDTALAVMNQDIKGSLTELWALVQANNGLLFREEQAPSKTRGEENARLVGDKIQLTYTRRSTAPHFTCMTYNAESESGFGYLPLSRATLVLWVYLYDPEDPSRALPASDGLPSCDSQLITNFFGKPQDSGPQDQASSSVSISVGRKSQSTEADEAVDSDATVDDPQMIDLSKGGDEMEVDEDSVLQSVLARSLQER